jgi:hypothetical protein
MSINSSIGSAFPDYYVTMMPSGRAVGLAAFAFFFIKGLLWLLVPAALLLWGC